MPDPIQALAIFSMMFAVGVSIWKGNYGFALWHFGILSFLIYLQYWKWSKTESK